MSAAVDTRPLRDMVYAARRAQKHAKDVTEQAFYQNEIVQDAVAWCITIIGEAARRVTDPVRPEIPQVPWRLMTGMRNRLVHEYTNIRLDIVWATLNDDLPKLIEAIEGYLNKPKPSAGGAA
jgi:uncharacterized protein with HEPN domain